MYSWVKIVIGTGNSWLSKLTGLGQVVIVISVSLFPN
jgi:hypothetical protein